MKGYDGIMENKLVYPDKDSAKDALLKAVAQLFENNVMSFSGHANLSVRISHNSYIITNIGNVRNLSRDNFAVVDIDGTILEGSIDPTNLEIIDMHAIVYSNRPEVNAIIHTHSLNILAFALANRSLPCRYEAMLRYGQASDVPVAQWGPRGSKESIEAIKVAIESSPMTNSVILANHGVLAFGPNPLSAARLITALEEGAFAELAAGELGGAQSLPTDALQKIRLSMERVIS